MKNINFLVTILLVPLFSLNAQSDLELKGILDLDLPTAGSTGKAIHVRAVQNISDLTSQITVDSLAYMKIERDFGTFDRWQEDFIGCALSARNGWAVTLYSTQLKRYINTIIDLHSQNVMIGMQPVIVLDCWEHSYYRDYLKDRKTYIYAMMKELNWDVIEQRFQVAEKIHKILG